MLAVVLGHRPDDSLPLGCPAIQARHGQIDARLMDKLQTLWVEPGDTLPVAGTCVLDARRVLLAGMK
jgi:hypothetical protein